MTAGVRRTAVALATCTVVVAGAVAAQAHVGPAASAERPRPCTRGEVRGVVERYVLNFNRGAFRTLDRRVFAAEPQFRWYSTGGPGPRFGAESRNRSTLMAHLRERRAAGDRLELTRLIVHRNSRPPRAAPRGNFEFDLIRSPGEAPRPGKGAVYCYRSVPDRIFVWSMGNAG